MMIAQKIGYFTAYVPEDALTGVLYLHDEQGRDWYQVSVDMAAEAYIMLDRDNRVVGVSTDATALFPSGMTVLAVLDYDPARADTFIADGYVWQAGAFVLPPARLIGYAAEKRWQVETGGISLDGLRIATDDRSKTLITGGRIKADANPEHTLRFKAAGGFVTLGAAQIIAISDAVFAHTQAAFDAEDAVLESISEGAISTLAEIDAWPWPGAGA